MCTENNTHAPRNTPNQYSSEFSLFNYHFEKRFLNLKLNYVCSVWEKGRKEVVMYVNSKSNIFETLHIALCIIGVKAKLES